MIRHSPVHLKDFLQLCEACEAVQNAVLLDILQQAETSVIGRRFGFERIKDSAAYCTSVTPTIWSDVEPYAQKLAGGEGDQLFAGLPEYFICTSGTTGSIKIIPESAAGRLAKSITARLRLEAMCCHAPAIQRGKLLPLVNNAIEGYTEAGIAYGSASGITLLTAPESIRAMIAFPPEILEIGYSNVLDYLIMRFAVEQDVRAIFGNNAGRIEQLCLRAEADAEQIINDIETGSVSYADQIPEGVYASLQSGCVANPGRGQMLREAYAGKKRFTPEVYWPKLQVVSCWLSGSVGRYVESIRGVFDDKIFFFDIGYGATEGKFNIPLEPEKSAGPLAIHAAFYEFKPLNGSDRMLLAHEVQAGESYELFVTNYSGLYRYGMRDIVRIEGFTGTTPRIVFEQKAGDVLNLCGEKVAASSLIALVTSVVGEQLVHWCVVGEDLAKRYHFFLELDKLPEDIAAALHHYSESLEQALCEDNLIYPVFRGQKLLQPAVVSLMRPGWQEALYAGQIQSGHNRAQVKLPLVYTSVPLKSFEASNSG